MKQKLDKIIENIGGAGEITGNVIGWFKSKSWIVLCAAGAVVVIGTITFFSKMADGYRKHK